MDNMNRELRSGDKMRSIDYGEKSNKSGLWFDFKLEGPGGVGRGGAGGAGARCGDRRSGLKVLSQSDDIDRTRCQMAMSSEWSSDGCVCVVVVSRVLLGSQKVRVGGQSARRMERSGSIVCWDGCRVIWRGFAEF
jgi:hypothetical protein